MNGLDFKNFKRKDPAKAFKPSPQQADFFDWVENGSGSCVLEAVAGSGKTSTLCEGIRMMNGSIFFGAFSKDIADEIQKKIGHLGKANISTMHAAGMREWKKVANKFFKVDGNKCRDIYRELTWKNVEYGILESPVISLVSFAKQAGVGIEGTNMPMSDARVWNSLIDHFGVETFSEKTQIDNREIIIILAQQVYESSLKVCKDIIDFDDMILAPLFFGVTITKYDWILLDEAQDTNVVRRLLALRMMHPKSRLVAVGDRHQAIFGFTGADATALSIIAEETKAVIKPLSVSFRCAQDVVKHAQKYVSHIEAAPTATKGAVRYQDSLDTIKIGDVILCRFNAPLMTQAYTLISQGIPARVEGKEIGKGLKQLVNRWKVKDVYALLERLQKYVEREVEKHTKRENLRGVETVTDKVECLRVIINRVISKGKKAQSDVVEEIDNLFGNSDDPEEANKPCVRLSSIHKSKGREWDVVFWIITGPSPYAKKDWEKDQEQNLCYVATTRAKSELVLVTLKKGKE